MTEEEFMSVSDLVRGRSKLEDVNQVLHDFPKYSINLLVTIDSNLINYNLHHKWNENNNIQTLT